MGFWDTPKPERDEIADLRTVVGDLIRQIGREQQRIRELLEGREPPSDRAFQFMALEVVRMACEDQGISVEELDQTHFDDLLEKVVGRLRIGWQRNAGILKADSQPDGFAPGRPCPAASPSESQTPDT